MGESHIYISSVISEVNSGLIRISEATLKYKSVPKAVWKGVWKQAGAGKPALIKCMSHRPFIAL